MKELSDKQKARRNELVDELRYTRHSIIDKMKEVNNYIEQLNGRIDEYNSHLTAVTEFRGEVASAIEDDWQSEEEKWFESDEAERQTIWKDEWECEYPENIDLIEDITVPELKHDEELESLPSEPD